MDIEQEFTIFRALFDSMKFRRTKNSKKKKSIKKKKL